MRLALSLLSLSATLSFAAGPAPEAPDPGVVPRSAETLDTADSPAPPPAPSEAPAPPAAPRAADAAPVPDSSAAPARGALTLRNPVLERLNLSGTVQLKGFYHDFASRRDADKRLSLQVRRFKLGLEGYVNDAVGFTGGFLMDGANKSFGTDEAYLWWRLGDKLGFKGGKLKRPFSQEALQPSGSLYTVERGELYHDFLANTTGYAFYDLGLMAYGDFAAAGAAIGYEVGVFNGKQSQNGYAGQHDEKVDAGFLAKDVVARLTVAPVKALRLEAAVSTKAAEDKTNAYDFAFAANTAYEIGADLSLGHARLLGEASWGDNHRGADSLIIAGSPEFFAFYVAGVWREDYRRGRASEMVLKLEGLDPDFAPGKGEGKPNDGLLRYTVGCNYFFNPAVSVLVDYGVLQPVTKVSGQDRLIHGLDAMWRLSF